MNKEMIISSGAHDTRVAILEDDQVVEVFIEREHQRGVVGNIYKGRVSKVLPGMQSSFVDIGLERDAFLYVSEVINTVEEFEKLAGEDEDAAEPAEPPVTEPAPALRRVLGTPLLVFYGLGVIIGAGIQVLVGSGLGSLRLRPASAHGADGGAVLGLKHRPQPSPNTTADR